MYCYNTVQLHGEIKMDKLSKKEQEQFKKDFEKWLRDTEEELTPEMVEAEYKWYQKNNR